LLAAVDPATLHAWSHDALEHRPAGGMIGLHCNTIR